MSEQTDMHERISDKKPGKNGKKKKLISILAITVAVILVRTSPSKVDTSPSP